MPRASHPITRLIRKKHRKKKKKTRVTIKPRNSEPEPESSEEEASEFGYKLKPSASQPHNALQVQPLGNLLLASAPNIRNPGLGSLHVLPDSLLLDDLLPLLSPKDLSLLCAASKALYAFSTHDPLWRPLALLHLGPDFRFSRSWRFTFLSSKSPDPKPAAITIRGFFSDYLFQSWLCANIRMRDEWISTDNIPRRRAASFSVDEFVAGFEEPNKPVLIEGCLDGWPAMERWRSRESLMELCGDARFSAGPVEMKLENYFRYADAAREERPLYLFDPKFAEKVPEMGRDYEVPAYFREDLFSLLGRERPDYRWVIIGPAGSGSSFHVDPNSTSAWNAVVKGSKKWVMFPPEVVPPGVHPSPDGAEVACPVSIMEWFMNFYAACRDWKRRPVECVCKAGEVVFVPNGWWHLVINLEDSIAITQNYVSRRNLLNVLDFLKKPNACELVSGTKDRTNLHDKFRTAIEAAFPGTIDELSLKAREKMMAQHKKRSFWESVTDANVGGFKFSF